MRAIVVACVIAFATLPASAANLPKIAPSLGGDCSDPQDNVTMTACATADEAAADKELNDVFAEVIASIRATDTSIMPADTVKDWEKTMRDGERAWIAFRDADCDGAVAYEWYGGSGAGLAVASCRRDLTRARIADLKARYIDR